MKFFRSAAVFILLLVRLTFPDLAAGHGFAGARFFPATLSTDDPFVNDELSLPTISAIETPEGRETTISVEIAKRITPNLGIELSEEFIDLNPKHEHEVSGFGNIELSAKYQFFTSAEHEAILSLGAGHGGTYKVVWRVTSMDTHLTDGDFHFQIVGTQRAAASSRPK